MFKTITLSILMLGSFVALADREESIHYATFAELATFPEKFDKKKVALYGYLKSKNGEVYLCESMEVCLTKSKSKLIIMDTAGDESELKELLNCHIEFFGEFYKVDENFAFDKRTILGRLKGYSSPNLSISSGYLKLNNQCDIYNKFTEKNGDIGLLN